MGFPDGSGVNNPGGQGMWVWCLGQQDPPGGGNRNPLQYSCLKNPMDRGAWWATVHGVAKNQTWLKRLSMQACTHQAPVQSMTCGRPSGLAKKWGPALDHGQVSVSIWASGSLIPRQASQHLKTLADPLDSVSDWTHRFGGTPWV